MEKKDIAQGFLMQWAIYFTVAYLIVIISNQATMLTATIVICALLAFLAAIVTTIISLASNKRLERLETK